MCFLLRYVDTKTMKSVNDSDIMEDMITFRQWSLQFHARRAAQGMNKVD